MSKREKKKAAQKPVVSQPAPRVATIAKAAARIITAATQVPSAQVQKTKQKKKKAKMSAMSHTDGGMKILAKKLSAAYTTFDKVILEHTVEEVIPIFGTGGTGVISHHFYINASNSSLFPIFATIASCYTKYELLEFIATFVTTSGQFVSTTQSGEVCLVVNYDPQMPPFASTSNGYEQAIHYNPRTVTPVFESASIPCYEQGSITGAGFERKAYVVHPSNNGTVPAGTESSINDYCPGVLNVLVSNCPVSTQIGRLIVQAKFKLWRYRIPDPASFAPTIHLRWVPVSGAGNLFQNDVSVVSGSNNNALSITVSGNAMTVVPTYNDCVIMVNYVLGNGSNITCTGGITPTDATAQNMLKWNGTADVASFVFAGSGSTTIQGVYFFHLATDSQGAVLTFDTATFSASNPTGDILITVLPSQLLSALAPISVAKRLSLLESQLEWFKKRNLMMPMLVADGTLKSSVDVEECKN